MTDVTKILKCIELGDPNAENRLLPLVYEELRKLAISKMRQYGDARRSRDNAPAAQQQSTTERVEH